MSNLVEYSRRMFTDYLEALSRQAVWGPFLILAGIFVFYFSSLGRGEELTAGDYMLLGGGIFLAVSGVLLMFRQTNAGTRLAGLTDLESQMEDAAYLVQQLSRNYEILRAQTNQGFLLSGVFMSIGLLIIIASLFAPSFGLRTEGVDNLGVVAGIVTEFISGSALLLYRLNFSRLNDTSDRLDDSWRILAGYRLAQDLPEDKRSETIAALVLAMVQPRSRTSIPSSGKEAGR